MLCDENVQIRVWMLWIIFTVYSIEAFLVVWIQGFLNSWTALTYVVCVWTQSLLLACAMFWRLSHQAVLLDM